MARKRKPASKGGGSRSASRGGVTKSASSPAGKASASVKAIDGVAAPPPATPHQRQPTTVAPQRSASEKAGVNTTARGGKRKQGTASVPKPASSEGSGWALTGRQLVVAVALGVALGAVLFQAMNASYIGGGGDGADDAVPVGTRDDWMCHPKRLPPRIVWNRIYKTGGVPLARFLGEAAEHHGWTYARSNIFDFFVTQRNEDLRMEIAVGVTTGDFPDGKLGDKPVSFRGRPLDPGADDPTPAMLFDQSMAFVDYTQWGLPQPEYINVIRHPLERIVQNFQQMKRYQAKRPDAFPCTWNVTFNQCLEQRRTRTCMVASSCGANNLMTHTMCGSHGVCKDPSSKEALEQALHNLQYRYAVVGVLEYLPTSMELFGAVLPGYFASLPALVEGSDMFTAKGMPSATSDTPALDAADLSPENLRYVVETNANDVKLYRAALRLLQRRADACGIAMRSTRDVVAQREADAAAATAPQ